MSPRITRALLSVSDKTGLTELASALQELGVELVSTGGTARHLKSAGIRVRDVADYTGFPEMMDGRLKTLHPMIFGGILCRHDEPEDMRGIASHGIVDFGLVVVNLYPFQQTVAKGDVTWVTAIENIDIGGPSLVRAAAKNHAFVTVATDPAQYDAVIDQLRAHSLATTPELRRHLATEAFCHTASYDQAIASYFLQHDQATQANQPTMEGNSDSPFPDRVMLSLRQASLLRYGENPHQAAVLYQVEGETGPAANVVRANQLNGKELSYNNLLDADAALSIARSLPHAGVAVIKHNNPCGAASAIQIATATQQAMEGDPVSAFGSILGFNQTVDAASAEYLSTPGLFVEAIVAPRFEPAAIEILTTRPKWKSNVRLLEVGPLSSSPQTTHYRWIDGGVLCQEADVAPDSYDEWQVVTQAQPDDSLIAELRFAWAVVRHVKSNAIVLCRDQTLIGVGAGQMSRVDSVQIAIRKGGERVRGSVLASDAFFPFPDSVEEASVAGVVAFIQPGGSRRDQEVIDACNAKQLPMIFTQRRHFKH